MRQSLATKEKEHDAALPLHAADQAHPAGSPERERLEMGTVLVDDYEARHHPISSPD